MTETAEKLSRVRKYLKTKKLDGLILSTRANVAWLSGGCDNHVVSQSEQGVGALVVTAKQALLVASRIEIDRLHGEEPLAAFAAKSYPWIQPLGDALTKLLSGKKYISDDHEATGFAKLPREASWMDEFRHELVSFPGGRHDDQVDSVSQFLNWAVGPGGRNTVRDREARRGGPRPA